MRCAAIHFACSAILFVCYFFSLFFRSGAEQDGGLPPCRPHPSEVGVPNALQDTPPGGGLFFSNNFFFRETSCERNAGICISPVWASVEEVRSLDDADLFLQKNLCGRDGSRQNIAPLNCGKSGVTTALERPSGRACGARAERASRSSSAMDDGTGRVRNGRI